MLVRLIALALIATGGYVMLKSRQTAAAPISADTADGQGGDTAPPMSVPDMVKAINAEEFGGWFNPADVLAIIEIESSFRADAYRAEPQIGDASYGLMQVLYSTARDRGYQGPPEGLFDPATNIRIGMRQLKWSWDFLAARLRGGPTTAVWIGSYNAGVGNAINNYVPWAYVAKWQAARAVWALRV